MKKLRQKHISKMANISQSMLSEILNGNARPSWNTAKRLSSVMVRSTPDQWMEAPPEVLRQIVDDFKKMEASQ